MICENVRKKRRTTDCASEKNGRNDEKILEQIDKNALEKLKQIYIYNKVIIW